MTDCKHDNITLDDLHVEYAKGGIQIEADCPDCPRSFDLDQLEVMYKLVKVSDEQAEG